MICVPTYISKSKIQGVGLFSVFAINDGQEIWRNNPEVDFVFSQDEIRDILPQLNEKMKSIIHKFAYLSITTDSPDAVWNWDGDSGRMMNHSRQPNTSWDAKTKTLRANRVINSNEELTSDYREWDMGEHEHYY